MTNAILRVRCPDRTGIIAALSDFVFRHGGNILDLDQHRRDQCVSAVPVGQSADDESHSDGHPNHCPPLLQDRPPPRIHGLISTTSITAITTTPTA